MLGRKAHVLFKRMEKKELQKHPEAQKGHDKTFRNRSDYFPGYLFSESAQRFTFAIPLKPQGKPLDLEQSFIEKTVKVEYATKYLEGIGAEPTPENIKMVNRHMGIEDKCKVSCAWKSRGSSADCLYVTPKIEKPKSHPPAWMNKNEAKAKADMKKSEGTKGESKEIIRHAGIKKKEMPLVLGDKFIHDALHRLHEDQNNHSNMFKKKMNTKFVGGQKERMISTLAKRGALMMKNAARKPDRRRNVKTVKKRKPDGERRRRREKSFSAFINTDTEENELKPKSNLQFEFNKMSEILSKFLSSGIQMDLELSYSDMILHEEKQIQKQKQPMKKRSHKGGNVSSTPQESYRLFPNQVKSTDGTPNMLNCSKKRGQETVLQHRYDDIRLDEIVKTQLSNESSHEISLPPFDKACLGKKELFHYRDTFCDNFDESSIGLSLRDEGLAITDVFYLHHGPRSEQTEPIVDLVILVFCYTYYSLLEEELGIYFNIEKIEYQNNKKRSGNMIKEKLLEDITQVFNRVRYEEDSVTKNSPRRAHDKEQFYRLSVVVLFVRVCVYSMHVSFYPNTLVEISDRKMKEKFNNNPSKQRMENFMDYTSSSNAQINFQRMRSVEEFRILESIDQQVGNLLDPGNFFRNATFLSSSVSWSLSPQVASFPSPRKSLTNVKSNSKLYTTSVAVASRHKSGFGKSPKTRQLLSKQC